MINEAQLREMSRSERRELAHTLALLDYPHPLLDLNWHRGRMLGILVSTIACVVLFAWIIVLILTLHRQYTASHWELAWVGFDVFLLCAFALTGWAFWRGRQIVIACLLVTSTLLCCDAWFDVILALGSSGIWESVTSAVVIELPVAYLMLRAARRMIRLSTLVAMGARSEAEETPPLRRIPLLGGEPTLGTMSSSRSGKRDRSGASKPSGLA